MNTAFNFGQGSRQNPWLTAAQHRLQPVETTAVETRLPLVMPCLCHILRPVVGSTILLHRVQSARKWVTSRRGAAAHAGVFVDDRAVADAVGAPGESQRAQCLLVVEVRLGSHATPQTYSDGVHGSAPAARASPCGSSLHHLVRGGMPGATSISHSPQGRARQRQPRLRLTGPMLTTMTVREFPPRLSCSSLVSWLER